MSKTINVLNKSQTPFKIFNTKDRRKDRFVPGTSRELPEALANKLLKNYPGQIIRVDSLAAEFPSADVAEVKEEVVEEVSDEIEAPTSTEVDLKEIHKNKNKKNKK